MLFGRFNYDLHDGYKKLQSKLHNLLPLFLVSMQHGYTVPKTIY